MNIKLPDTGIYLLIGTLENPIDFKTKSKSFSLKPGWYYYCGSAMKNLGARVKRHMSTNKKNHWHIDYLLESLDLKVIAPFIIHNEDFEHKLAELLSEYNDITPVSGFGASDCYCDTHLFYSDVISGKHILKKLFTFQMEEIARKLDIEYKGVETPVEKFTSPWEILVSCVISLRTKDEVTGPAADRLFGKAPGVKELAALSEEEIGSLIYPAGFYKTKSKNLKKIAQIIDSKYGGQVPDNQETLMSLPNVGIKTANLVLANGFGQHEICVDIHVHRICNRLGLIKTKTPEESEKALKPILPMNYIREYNGLLVKHGQNICKPRKTNCIRCPLKTLCLYNIKHEDH